MTPRLKLIIFISIPLTVLIASAVIAISVTRYGFSSLGQAGAANRVDRVDGMEAFGPWSKGADLSGRGYVPSFKNTLDDFLYVGPTEYGLITHEWWFRLVRPIRVGGHFEGVIIMTLRPDSITKSFRDLAPGPTGTATIVTSDGRLIARLPTPPVGIYDRKDDDPSLPTALMKAPAGRYCDPDSTSAPPVSVSGGGSASATRINLSRMLTMRCLRPQGDPTSSI